MKPKDPRKQQEKELADLRKRLVWLTKEGVSIAREGKRLYSKRLRNEDTALEEEALLIRTRAYKDVVSPTSAACKILLGGNGGAFELPPEQKRADAKSSVTDKILQMQNKSVITEIGLVRKGTNLS